MSSIKKLYHGSHYWTTLLRPGIHYTEKEVFWDETESNRFLYASPDKDECIVLGWASAIEKHYEMDEFHHENKSIRILLKEETPPLKKLLDLAVFLYEITVKPEDKWINVNNKVNSIDNEYKTPNEIEYDKVEKIDIPKHLSTFKISLQCSQKTKSNQPLYTFW